MIINTWGEVYCSHCKARNFICLNRDVDLMKCYKCNKDTPMMEDVEEHVKFWTDYKSVTEFMENESAYATYGQERP